METMKKCMTNGENIYLRGFGTFLLKKRAVKKGRNILKGTFVQIPTHVIPVFKPTKEFLEELKAIVKVN
jgi:DNA-binding protein HU-beta